MPLRFDPDLAARAWPDIPEGVLLLVPLGSCEQHGPHLPLTTDTDIAAAVTAALVERSRLQGMTVVTAPAIPYGASGEHEGFAGTISIGTEALTALLVEFGRSAARWAGRLLFVNGHGGNVEALAAASTRLRHEGRDAAWLPCGATRLRADLHAGGTETSMMLALAAERVRYDLAVAGDTRPAQELLPELRARGVGGVSPSGVLGDPAGATGERGEEILETICAEALARVRSWTVSGTGMLSLPEGDA